MSELKSFAKRIYNKILIDPFLPWGVFGSYVKFPIKMLFRKIGIGAKYYKRIETIKNTNNGKRCFIISTGPSLTVEDIKLLKNEITIGENSIFKLYDELEWVPTYYAMIDPSLTNRIIKENKDIDFNKFAVKNCFFNSINRNLINCNNAIFFDVNWLDHVYHYGKSKRFKYNSNLKYGIYDCYSITQMCVIISIYMGFSDIYIIGADNNYLGDKQHFSSYSGESKADYDTAVLMQRANDLGYEFIKKIAEKENVNLFNATRGGNIKCLKRVNLEDVLNS